MQLACCRSVPSRCSPPESGRPVRERRHCRRRPRVTNVGLLAARRDGRRRARRQAGELHGRQIVDVVAHEADLFEVQAVALGELAQRARPCPCSPCATSVMPILAAKRSTSGLSSPEISATTSPALRASDTPMMSAKEKRFHSSPSGPHQTPPSVSTPSTSKRDGS